MKKYIALILVAILSGCCWTLDAKEKTKNFKNGDVYVGEWAGGGPSGYGKMKYANGDVYEGYWSVIKDEKGKKVGVPNGKGKYTFRNGNTYNGDWEDGKQNGYGTYTDAQKRFKYEGQVKDGLKQGKGILTFADGSYYDGLWNDNKMAGEGDVYVKGKNIKFSGKFTPVPNRDKTELETIIPIEGEYIERNYTLNGKWDGGFDNFTGTKTFTDETKGIHVGTFVNGKITDGTSKGVIDDTYICEFPAYYNGNWSNGRFIGEITGKCFADSALIEAVINDKELSFVIITDDDFRKDFECFGGDTDKIKDGLEWINRNQSTYDYRQQWNPNKQEFEYRRRRRKNITADRAKELKYQITDFQITANEDGKTTATGKYLYDYNYSGEILDGIPNGNGRISFENNEYSGRWINGKFVSGEGYYITPRGERVEVKVIDKTIHVTDPSNYYTGDYTYSSVENIGKVIEKTKQREERHKTFALYNANYAGLTYVGGSIPLDNAELQYVMRTMRITSEFTITFLMDGEILIQPIFTTSSMGSTENQICLKLNSTNSNIREIEFNPDSPYEMVYGDSKLKLSSDRSSLTLNAGGKKISLKCKYGTPGPFSKTITSPTSLKTGTYSGNLIFLPIDGESLAGEAYGKTTLKILPGNKFDLEFTMGIKNQAVRSILGNISQSESLEGTYRIKDGKLELIDDEGGVTKLPFVQNGKALYFSYPGFISVLYAK